MVVVAVLYEAVDELDWMDKRKRAAAKAYIMIRSSSTLSRMRI